MHFLIFAISYPIIWILSLLPMRVLYILSDFLYILFFYLIGYRKKVVLKNLQLAFPTKNLSELKTIQKDFFKHFTDIFVESIKAFSITKKTLLKRYKFTNPELINEFELCAGAAPKFNPRRYQKNVAWADLQRLTAAPASALRFPYISGTLPGPRTPR